MVSWQSTPDGWAAWVVCAVEDDQVVTVLLPACLAAAAGHLRGRLYFE